MFSGKTRSVDQKLFDLHSTDQPDITAFKHDYFADV
jgi:hypothetical protein